MGQDTGHKGIAAVPAVAALHGHIDVHAVARLPIDGFRGKVGVKAVAQGSGFHHGFEMHGIIGGGHGIGVAEIDLILPGPLLVMGALRLDAHVLQIQADFPADVLPLILRGHVHIAGMIEGFVGGISVFIGFEQVEFKLRAEADLAAQLACLPDRILQNGAAVHGEGPSIGMADVAEHLHHLAPAGPPGKHIQSGRNGMQKQIRPHWTSKARDGGGIKGNAVGKSALQFLRHDRDILLSAGHITKSQADELHILLLHVFKYFLSRI